MKHSLDKIADSGRLLGLWEGSSSHWSFNKAAHRRQAGRNARAVRRRTERHELITGLAVFIMATHEKPNLNEVKAAFVCSTHHAPSDTRPRSQAELFDPGSLL